MSQLKKELLRKLIHLLELPILGGFSILHFYFSHKIGILSLTGLLIILLEIEYFRIDYQTKIGVQITKFFQRFVLRRHERNNITGAIFFVISAIIAFSAFEYKIALLALLFSVFGDLVSALMGIACSGKKIFREKTYIGTLSGFLVNITIGLMLMPSEPFLYLSMAFTGSVVETLTQKLDDNFTVPLFAGFVGEIIVSLS